MPLSAPHARDARDALAKALYDALFSWLIAQCIGSLRPDRPTALSIGILDIFGFEIFERNSFEQLMINFANEKLQSLFNATIFEAERAVYREEGLDASYIVFTNNQPCVELLEGRRTGVLAVLDDQCLGVAADDDKLLSALRKAHGDGRAQKASARDGGLEGTAGAHCRAAVRERAHAFVCATSPAT